jgi:hypothetical protein
MTVSRRELFGLGALGVGAVATGGCVGFLPWGRASDQPDLDALLRELDRVILHLRALEPDPKRFGIKPGSDFEAGHAASLRLMTTACLMGTYRHLPESTWREPAVERRLAETLPLIHDTLLAARNHLVETSDDECERIDRRLEKDPDLTMRIIERIDEYASQAEVPIEQRTYLRTATAQLAGRFRFEGMKEVKAKLTSKWDRTLAARKNDLGFPATSEVEADDQTTGLRARFRTRASASEVRVAACKIEPRVVLDGMERRILLDSDDYPCPNRPDDAILGNVHVEHDKDGANVVTIIVYSSDESLSASVTDIARRLQLVLEKGAPPPPTRLLGAAGESCRTRVDCEGDLDCTDGTCGGEGKAGSAKLLHTTGEVVKWGAWLLIPPICAIGFLVLTVALFMVIVAGCMYAAGN